MNYCIVVADGSRARFFTLEQPGIPELEGGPDLTEHRDLVNPEKEQRSRDLFSNLKSGRHQAPGGGPDHGYDDHRGRHTDEIERRFARRLSAEISDFTRERRVEQLVLVADPRMLGFLRKALGSHLASDVRVAELKRDLSSLTAPRIHARLADAGLVPARAAP
jgi:protein required for attachment to host cells